VFFSAGGFGDDLDKDDRLRDSKIGHIGDKKSSGALISIFKIFLVCFFCVLIALVVVAILSIEMDIEICQKMRTIPEVEVFQKEVYDPLKGFVHEKIQDISKTIDTKLH